MNVKELLETYFEIDMPPNVEMVGYKNNFQEE